MRPAAVSWAIADPAGRPGSAPFARVRVFERAQQPAELSGSRARAATSAPVPRSPSVPISHSTRVLPERPAAAEVAVVERADALGHNPVEAPDLIDERV